MSDYLNPIMSETDLLSYEKFLNDISETKVCDKNIIFQKLIGKRLNIKLSVNNRIYSYFGILKKAENEYLELQQNGGRKTMILKPETVVSITII